MTKFDVEGRFKTTESVESNDPHYIQSSSCLVRCRYFLHSFITKWNTNRMDFSASVQQPSEQGTGETTTTTKFLNATAGGGRAGSSSNLLQALVGGSSLLGGASVSRPDSALDIEPLSNCSNGTISNNNAIVEDAFLSAQNSAGAKFELPALENPLPRELHFELPMNHHAIVVRDVLDPKRNQLTPDLGSIIAHALSSGEYDEKKHIGKGEEFCELNFGDAKLQYSVKIYFPEKFEHLRALIFADGGEEQFIRSLSCATPWHPQGGKSGASFFRTDDERFVLKSMSRFELESFKKCGLKYMDYITMALVERKLTALCKIFGVYSVVYTNRVGGQSLKLDLLVMEFLFYRKDVKQTWDLKGSLRNRWSSAKTDDASSVLLDENLVQDLWQNQLYVHPHCKSAISQAMINDSHFLSSQDIMDYSLLAGICRDTDEVIIGIVDYMRTYTLDKKVESLVKTALPIAHSPTVISPEQYCKRFYEAIDGYFAISPDQWTNSTDTFN